MCFENRQYYFAVVVLLALLSPPLPLSASDTDRVASEVEETVAVETSQSELATDYMVGVFYGHVASDTEMRLAHTGLAQPEIEQIVDNVAQEFASCVISSLEKADAPETDFTIKMLAEGAPMEEVSDYMDGLSADENKDPIAVFELELDACSKSIDARYGLE